jgi:hypothetical protein
MPRFHGAVGYGVSSESPAGSGVWKDTITEIEYFGDVVRNTRSTESGDQLNDDITVGNSISIVADEYANNNFLNIKYVSWSGVLWTVTQVEVQSPRLILTLGRVYNGPTV